MEKLIDLLNEYWDINWNKAMVEHQDTYIISKKFWFIERLIENDKISVLNIDNRIALSEYKNYERIIIYLAISDNPIQDLIDLLR